MTARTKKKSTPKKSPLTQRKSPQKRRINDMRKQEQTRGRSSSTDLDWTETDD